MSEKPAPSGEGRQQMSYEGNRVPWWVAGWWIAFLAFYGLYHVLYAFPDLKAWLANAAAQIWK